MKHLDLFSGIGGFALAAEQVWPEIEHVFCDNDPFCQAILKKHFPHSQIYGDIRTLTNTRSKESRGMAEQPRNKKTQNRSIDLLTGGFPCQPFSAAGKRKGTSDDRHLWPEMRRVIQEFSPTYVVAENVRGLLSIDGGLVFEQVCLDLEALGYEVQPFVIPACAVNAPHRRDRVWIVARNTKHNGQLATERREGNGKRTCESSRAKQMEQPEGSALSRDQDASNSNSHGQPRKRSKSNNERSNRLQSGERLAWNENWPQVAARLCPLDDGLPDGLARPKGWRNAALKGAGNAIVPQVAIEIFKTIKELDSHL